MWNLGWGMGLPDPAELVNSLVATKAPSNYGGYSNPSIDKLGWRRRARPTGTSAARCTPRSSGS
jgi:ABC-type oligopeptide transport system substrate-binding subunit